MMAIGIVLVSGLGWCLPLVYVSRRAASGPESMVIVRSVLIA